MDQSKEKTRQKYRLVREEMDPMGVDQKSRIICSKLLKEIDWERIRSVHIYDTIKSLNEVNVSEILNKLSILYPKINVTVAGSAKNSKLPSNKFDLIVVPCLAFDKDNYRLGWGSGWYDKFLATQPQAQKIGLCFGNGFIKDGFAHQPHDIPLNKIITEV